MSNRLMLALLALAGALVLGIVWGVARDGAPREGGRVEATRSHTPGPAQAASPLESAVLAKEPSAPAPEVVVPETTERTAASSAYEEELAEGYWVEGRVVFPAGTPVDEQPYVVAKGRKLEHGDYHRVPVASDGSFRVAFGKKTRKGWLRIDARYLYLEESVRVQVREADYQTLEPRLGGLIRGKLVLPEDCPVPLAEILEGQVTLSGEVDGRRGTQRVEKLTEDLTFEFGGLDPSLQCGLMFDTERIQPARLDGLSVEAGTERVIDLETGLGVTVAGRVVDEAGEPVPEAEVQTRVEMVMGWVGGTWRNTKTAADGTFLIHGAAPGELEVVATLKGYDECEAELGELLEGDVKEEVELVLRRGFEIAGRVVWPDGEPAAGASIFARSSNERRGFYVDPRSGFKTDADGRFRITGLDEGEYTIAAQATRTEEVLVASKVTGKERKRKKKTKWRARAQGVETGTELALELSMGMSLTGRVVDDQGAGLDRFLVRARRAGSVTFWNIQSTEGLSRTFRDAGGVFELEGFEPGDWIVQATARDHGDSEEVTIKVPDELDGLVLTCAREARVLGVVRTPGGAAVADAKVTASYKQDNRFVITGNNERTTRTNASGAFELEDVHPGSVGLTAEAEGLAKTEVQWIELAPAETRTGVELTLRTGGVITVELTGEHVEGCQVNISNWQIEVRKNFLSDADGRVEATNLPPGQYQISMRPSEEEVRAVLGETSLRSAYDILRRRERIELAEGETRHIVLHPPQITPIRMSGRVLAGKQPLAEIYLWARGEGHESTPSAQTDSEGRYEILLPGPGDYDVGVNDWEAGIEFSAKTTVPDTEHYEFDLAFPVGTVAGRVLGPDGKPVDGVNVSAEPQKTDTGFGAGAKAVTDHEGKYVLESVAAGTYTITAGGRSGYWYQSSERAYTEASVDSIIVTAGSVVRAVDLQVGEAGGLKGFVRGADGNPASAAIKARDAQGRSLGSWGIGGADRSGQFEISGLTPGPHTVWAEGGNGISKPVEVEIRAGETEHLELELEPAGSLVVTVTGGVDPSTVWLEVQDAQGYETSPGRPAGEEARWTFTPLAAGTYSVLVSDGERRAQKAVSVRVEETTEVELALE